jgi:hypothetical protein
MTADQVFILAFLLFVILNEVKDLASSGAEKMLDASLSLSMTEPNWRE